MQEAVRRSYITANPCVKLGMRRRNTKVKPEISSDEQTSIESALTKMDEWMRDCWLVAMRQGCRLSETAVPIRDIDLKTKTVTFHTKGNRVHSAPIHDDLLPLIKKAQAEKRKTLVTATEIPRQEMAPVFQAHRTRPFELSQHARNGRDAPRPRRPSHLPNQSLRRPCQRHRTCYLPAAGSG